MRRSASLFALIAGAFLVVGLVGIVIGSTSANSVASSRAGVVRVALTPSQVRPSACAPLNLQVLLRGAQVKGTSLGDLIIGTSGDDSLLGRNGDDCIVGGRGHDEIDGGSGYDICITNSRAEVKRCEVVILSATE